MDSLARSLKVSSEVLLKNLPAVRGSPLDKALEKAEEVLGAGDIDTAGALYTNPGAGCRQCGGACRLE